MRALLSTAFYESLITLRLNESAGWTAALLASALAAFLGRRGMLLALGTAGLASATLSVARFTDVYLPLASVATGAALAALPLVARHAGGAAGLLAGLAIDGAILAAADSHDLTLVLWGALVAIAIALGALKLASGLAPAPPARGGLVRGAAFGALLALEIAFLASPFAAARWLGIPVWLATLAGLGGLALGAMIAPRWPVWVLGALGLIDVALMLTPVRALSLALLQIAIGAAGARLGLGVGARGGSIAFAATLAPLLFVLLYFRSPLGISEWGAIVPLLAVLALAPALRFPRAHRHRSRATALALVVLTIVAAIPTPLADAREGREITLVTWNVHQGFGNRGALDPDIYVVALRDLDPDVVLLQESDTARLSSGGLDIVRYLADALGMRAAYGRGGPAILSRLPFQEGIEMRDAEWMFEAAVEIDGTTLWLQSVHFGRDQASRLAQANAVASAEGAPRILAGDFNFFAGLAGNPPHDIIDARYDDAWVEAGRARDDPNGYTFTTGDPRRRIDIIWLDGVEVISIDRVFDDRTRMGSDHIPVVARLRVPT